jgi:hypothetical protein
VVFLCFSAVQFHGVFSAVQFHGVTGPNKSGPFGFALSKEEFFGRLPALKIVALPAAR